MTFLERKTAIHRLNKGMNIKTSELLTYAESDDLEILKIMAKKKIMPEIVAKCRYKEVHKILLDNELALDILVDSDYPDIRKAIAIKGLYPEILSLDDDVDVRYEVAKQGLCIENFANEDNPKVLEALAIYRLKSDENSIVGKALNAVDDIKESIIQLPNWLWEKFKSLFKDDAIMLSAELRFKENEKEEGYFENVALINEWDDLPPQEQERILSLENPNYKILLIRQGKEIMKFVNTDNPDIQREIIKQGRFLTNIAKSENVTDEAKFELIKYGYALDCLATDKDPVIRCLVACAGSNLTELMNDENTDVKTTAEIASKFYGGIIPDWVINPRPNRLYRLPESIIDIVEHVFELGKNSKDMYWWHLNKLSKISYIVNGRYERSDLDYIKTDEDLDVQFALAQQGINTGSDKWFIQAELDKTEDKPEGTLEALNNEYEDRKDGAFEVAVLNRDRTSILKTFKCDSCTICGYRAGLLNPHLQIFDFDIYDFNIFADDCKLFADFEPQDIEILDLKNTEKPLIMCKSRKWADFAIKNKIPFIFTITNPVDSINVKDSTLRLTIGNTSSNIVSQYLSIPIQFTVTDLDYTKDYVFAFDDKQGIYGILIE